MSIKGLSSTSFTKTFNGSVSSSPDSSFWLFPDTISIVSVKLTSVILNSLSLVKSSSVYFILPVIVLGKVVSSVLNFKLIELLEATNPESPIAKFIAKKGEGIHHIAFAVDDIKAEIKRLQKEGFTVLNDVPKKGADNKLVAFLHPKSTNGVLIELCQEIN